NGYKVDRIDDLLPYKQGEDFLKKNLPRFLHQPADLRDLGIRRFDEPGRRLRFVNHDGWVLFDRDQLAPTRNIIADEPRTDSATLLELLVGWILRRGDSPYRDLENPPGRIADEKLRVALKGQESAAWYTRETNTNAILTVAVPITTTDGTGIVGAVILEQGSEYLTLANEELVRFMGIILLISLTVILALVGYSGRLAKRIRRLAAAADTALSPEGEIAFHMPGRKARDEIGGLARSFNTILKNLHDYTEYLRTLKQTLVHELRTPLSRIFTSLENLEQEPTSESQLRYLTRLRRGTEHLNNILNSMAEANQLERAIENTPKEAVHLKPVFENAVRAYRDAHTDHVFQWRCTVPFATILGSADLIIQMLDKLVNNAIDFSPPGSEIRMKLSGTNEELCISVSNQGPSLPQKMRNKLFDSLVSIRGGNQKSEHLGLGLYIVDLIVKFHGGTRQADNLSDGSGVVFKIYLPVTPR
ncbi:MAG: ATP-binding protein, partial [Gammaproteobacteria bacterium]